MIRPAEPGQEPRNHKGIVERRPRRLLNPPGEPPSRRTSAALPVLHRDQCRQFESLCEPYATKLPGGDLRYHESAALERYPPGAERDVLVALVAQLDAVVIEEGPPGNGRSEDDPS